MTRRIVGPTTLVFVAALLLFPSTATAANATSGTVTISKVTLEGTIEFLGTTESGIIFVPGATEQDFAWDLDARSLVVNSTVRTRYEVAHPQNPTSTLLGLPSSAPSQSEENFEGIRAHSASASPDSTVLIRSSQQGATVHGRTTMASMESPAHDQWIAGSQLASTASRPNPNGTWVAVPVPQDWAQLSMGRGDFEVTGDFEILVWEATIRVDENLYYAGETTQTDAGQVRQEAQRLVALRVTDGHLRFALRQGDAWVVAPAISTTVSGVAEFAGAQGILTTPEKQRLLSDEPLRVEGAFEVIGSASTAQEHRIRADLALVQGQLIAGNDAPILVGQVANSNRFPDLWIVVGAAAGVVTGCVALRVRRVEIDDVEYAMLFGTMGKGHRLARRLCRREPTNPDVLFLYGSTLLATGRHEDLFTRIEPLAEKIAPDLRRGIAYILAVGANVIGDAGRTMRWADEAAREPSLQAELQKRGIWNAPPRRPGTGQSGYA